MKKLPIQKLWVTIALVHWLISLLTDKLVITCESSVTYGIWKVLFLLFLFVFYRRQGMQSGNTARVIRQSVRF